MSEGSRTRVVAGAAAVAVGWKHRSTLLSYATLPARAFAGVLRAWCRGEEPAGLGRRAAVAFQGALGPEGSFAREKPAGSCRLRGRSWRVRPLVIRPRRGGSCSQGPAIQELPESRHHRRRLGDGRILRPGGPRRLRRTVPSDDTRPRLFRDRGHISGRDGGQFLARLQKNV